MSHNSLSFSQSVPWFFSKRPKNTRITPWPKVWLLSTKYLTSHSWSPLLLLWHSHLTLQNKLQIRLQTTFFTWKFASMCITHHCNKSILSLRKTLGGTFGPHLFSQKMSEPSTDLGDDVITCPNYDEATTCSPRLDKIPLLDLLPTTIPCATCLPASLNVPIQYYGKMDTWSDDAMSVWLYKGRWKRLIESPQLTLHLLGHPMSSHEPLPREDLVVMSKLWSTRQFSAWRSMFAHYSYTYLLISIRNGVLESKTCWNKDTPPRMIYNH